MDEKDYYCWNIFVYIKNNARFVSIFLMMFKSIL